VLFAGPTSALSIEIKIFVKFQKQNVSERFIAHSVSIEIIFFVKFFSKLCQNVSSFIRFFPLPLVLGFALSPLPDPGGY